MHDLLRLCYQLRTQAARNWMLRYGDWDIPRHCRLQIKRLMHLEAWQNRKATKND